MNGARVMKRDAEPFEGEKENIADGQFAVVWCRWVRNVGIWAVMVELEKVEAVVFPDEIGRTTQTHIQ